MRTTMKVAAEALLFLGFIMGFLASTAFVLWLVCGYAFVFISNAPNPGVVAYIPKWIFWFSILDLLYFTGAVKDAGQWVVNLLDFEGRARRREASRPLHRWECPPGWQQPHHHR